MESNSRAVTFVDAHCHIDLFPKPVEIVEAIEKAEVHTIAVTNAPFVFQNTKRLSEGSRFVHPALGLHPELVESHGSQIEQMISLLNQTRFIGEVGLDFVTPDRARRQRQSVVFTRVLEECAQFRDKIITVHSRRSAREVIAAVGSNYPGKVILHWFSGSLSELRRAISYGLWFSVNIAMTQSVNGLSIIAELPRDRVLTETDGPFVKPNGVVQTPPDVAMVVRELAEVWEVDETEAKSMVSNNFESMLS